MSHPPNKDAIQTKLFLSFHGTDFRRHFLNGATHVEPDSAGRLLVPPNLKDHAGLQKDIVLVSAVNKIEIWDSSKYHQLFDSFSADDFSNLAKDVMAKDKE
jgi:MraZ protein